MGRDFGVMSHGMADAGKRDLFHAADGDSRRSNTMKRTRKFLRKRFCMLTAAILTGLSALPSHAFADTVDVPVETVYHNGKKFAEISFFPKDVGLGKEGDWFVDPSKYTPSVKLEKATVTAAEYWADIIGDGAKNKDAWTIYLNTNEEKNAGAGSYSYRATGDKNNFLKHEAFIKDQLQDGKEFLVIDQKYLDEHGNKLATGDYGFSEITVG